MDFAKDFQPLMLKFNKLKVFKFFHPGVITNITNIMPLYSNNSLREFNVWGICGNFLKLINDLFPNLILFKCFFILGDLDLLDFLKLFKKVET